MKFKKNKVVSLAATLITFGLLSGGANGQVLTSGAVTGTSIFDLVAASDDGINTAIFPLAVPGVGSPIATLEADLAIPTGLLATLPVVEADGLFSANQGSGISQVFASLSGDTVSADFVFFDTETATGFSDLAFAITLFDDGLGGGEVVLGTTVLGDAAIAGTGATPVSFTSFAAPTDGDLRIIIAVADDDDTAVPSGIASAALVPEPSSTLLLGLGAFGMLVRRKRSN